MRFWLKIPICQSSMVHEGCWVNCPTRVGNLEASKAAEENPQVGYNCTATQAAADRVQRVAVEDFVLSQEDKPKKHQSARRDFAWNCHSPFKCAQDNSPWYPALMFQTMSCSTSAVVWSQSHLSSHSLINNLAVCNKSCYCSLLNRKLNNK